MRNNFTFTFKCSDAFFVDQFGAINFPQLSFFCNILEANLFIFQLLLLQRKLMNLHEIGFNILRTRRTMLRGFEIRLQNHSMDSS